jgi:hypothetical protein
MIGRGVAAPHIGEIYGWRSFFAGHFSGKRATDPEPSSPTDYTSIDAVLAKDVPFGSLIDTSHPMGELSPKIPHFGAVNRDFHLNVYGRISAQDKHIMTLDSSKCASRQDTQTEGWGHCRSQFCRLTKVCFKGKFAAKFQSTAEYVE